MPDTPTASKPIQFVRLLEDDGTWKCFEDNWRSQCENLDEDFDSYAEATFSVVRDLIQQEHRKAGVFGLKDGDTFLAMCQINTTPLPKYTGPVLRVRYMTLSPEYDLTNKTMSEYGNVLVKLLGEVLELAYLDDELKSHHIKFHLRSPADQQFFSALGLTLKEYDLFASIETRGSWLYISRK